MRNARYLIFALVLGFCVPWKAPTVHAEVDNLKVVTDASPDYSDMDSLIRSITGNWTRPEDKMWAVWYWNHIARRQTAPMIVHGTALTDPIRQFNDYGYTMCSTISGINCSIWDAMGYPVKYWDISNHTVPEVEYNGRWHMYDNSMSALYTLPDGKTIAGVEDIGKTAAGPETGGKEVPGYIAKYHCLTSTSPDGFLTGADTARALDEEYRCFNPNGLKYRSYYYDWDRGHRYILNLRDGEVYTRYYHSLGNTADFYVPNGGKDPDAANTRYHLRGNGVRTFTPALTDASLVSDAYSLSGVEHAAPSGVQTIRAGQPGSVVFKIEGANVITSVQIQAAVLCKTAADSATISISTTNGLQWQEVWKNGVAGQQPVDLNLTDAVNGSYVVLVSVTLKAAAAAANARLQSITFKTTTMLNSKTQPKLLLGKNTIYVGAGDPTESTVLWPDLEGDLYKPYVFEEKNIATEPHNPGYLATMHAAKANEEAYVVFKLDTPRDMTRVQYGGRLYNRAPGAHIDFLHSFDGGKTWAQSYSLTDTNQPWDVIHYETINQIPAGTRSVLLKYRLKASEAGANACGLYAVRMEANFRPAAAQQQPIEVTFNWSERQKDYSLVERSHTELVSKLPYRYTIDVGGADHPVVNWLRANPKGAVPGVKYGYSDGQDAGGQKFVGHWATYGKNLAVGKPYTVSVPSGTNWGAGDPDGKKLTDGVVGPPYAGGPNPTYALLWDKGTHPEVTVDLGQVQPCAAFQINLGAGYPWWDALKGEVKDQVEALTSTDGKTFTSQGNFDLNLHWKDLPVNHVWPDDETITAYTYTLAPPQPVQARYVRYKITPERSLTVSEVEVLDSYKSEPYDLKLALPDEKTADPNPIKTRVVAATGRPVLAEDAIKNKSRMVEDPVLESSTLHSIGVHWIIDGDQNKNARVDVHYRPAGTTEWKQGYPLLRVEKGAYKNGEGKTLLNVPEDGWLFAGSVVLLKPDTAYELTLNLVDADGGSVEKTLTTRTIAEPIDPTDAPRFHVAPGTGGGTGTAADPYRGLNEAQAHAHPGDVFLVHAGVYPGTFEITKNGEPGKPIIWEGAGDGEAILDGQAGAAQRPERTVSASDAHDVWFEKLTIRNSHFCVVAHRAQRLVIRHCHIYGCDYGITATDNTGNTLRGLFISDNTIEGPSTWPRTKGIEDARGIQISGEGQEICYNRIRAFGDGMDTFQSSHCADIDFHNNDISECTDDGNEMDESERNTRTFDNRYTNVFQGISVQPVYGGPVYIFRNALYNVVLETFKMHNSPSGVLIFNNTSVKKGMPLILATQDKVRNVTYRNNLFIGTKDNYAYENMAPMVDCDFDYDGFGGGPFGKFLKWNNVRYGTLDEAKKNAPVYHHAVMLGVGSPFVSGAEPPADEKQQQPISANDLRLKPDSVAVDAGEVLPNFDDGFSGKAPDLGAYEAGSPLPHYGPRP